MEVCFCDAWLSMVSTTLRVRKIFPKYVKRAPGSAFPFTVQLKNPFRQEHENYDSKVIISFLKIQ